MKTLKGKKSIKNKVMAFDIFERKYRKQIEMMIERILDTKDNLNDSNYDEMYDDAHEEAVFVLASEKNISLE
jgi:hypothetical protein